MTGCVVFLFLLGICVQNSLTAVVPKATNVPSYNQNYERKTENDNVQVATSTLVQKDSETPNSPPMMTVQQPEAESTQKPMSDPLEQHLPQIPQQEQNMAQTAQQEILLQKIQCLQAGNCNANTLNTSSNNEESKRNVDLVLRLQLIQRLIEYNQLKNLEMELRTTGNNGALNNLALALGVAPGVTSESGFNLYGGTNGLLTTSGLLGNGLVGTGLVGNGGIALGNGLTTSLLPAITGNLLTYISTILGNLNMPINNLIANVGPTGVPIPIPNLEIGLGNAGILTNTILNNLISTPGTGILGTGILPGIQKPSILGLLPSVGLGGTAINTVTGLPTLLTNRPLALLINAIHGTRDPLTGVRFLNRRSDENVMSIDLPWMVSVMVNGKMVAEGVLISDQHVLTVATPLLNVDLKDIEIHLGQSDRCNPVSNMKMSIISVMANPLFNPQTKANDMALLKLFKNIMKDDNKIQPICLPSMVSPYILKEVTVPTWESSSSNEQLCQPQFLQLPLRTEESCSKSIDPLALLTSDKSCISASMEKENICQAPTGRPVHHIIKDGIVELIGLVSNTAQCEKSDSVHLVRVQDHMKWLLDHVKDHNPCLKDLVIPIV